MHYQREKKNFFKGNFPVTLTFHFVSFSFRDHFIPKGVYYSNEEYNGWHGNNN